MYSCKTTATDRFVKNQEKKKERKKEKKEKTRRSVSYRLVASQGGRARAHARGSHATRMRETTNLRFFDLISFHLIIFFLKRVILLFERKRKRICYGMRRADRLVLTGYASAGCVGRRAEKEQWRPFDAAFAVPAGRADPYRRNVVRYGTRLRVVGLET